MATELILWRRLDAPGHDACRLERTGSGWRLDGAAVFRGEGGPARLAYQVECDARWTTRGGFVRGWMGARAVDLRAARAADGVWTLNERTVSRVEGCVDLDLGFTPATNLFQLRRVDLRPGEVAEVPVAWLDVEAGTLDVLQQRYERRADGSYWYEAPRFGYAAPLGVGDSGFIRDYPRLWRAELVVPV
jgi:hypothetical protein